jgi:lipid-binding SYLF domain-containing protein
MWYGQLQPVKDTAARTVVSLSLLIAMCSSLEVGYAADAEEQRLIEEATLTFERFLNNPGLASWYVAQGKNIKAVFIVPKFLRGAFLVGAAGGKGVLLAQDFVHGGWSSPAFYGMSAASVGAQAGFDSSEVVMIIQTFSGLERFYGAGTVRLGLDAGVTLGPWGEGGTTGLDIVTFAWSKGLFAGMSLDGLAVTAYDGSNEAYYGSQVKPEQILTTNAFSNPGANRLRAVVGRLVTP